MKIVTSKQMRALEKRADAAGNSYADMMERAGTLAAQAIMRKWDVREKRVLILVGPGNNGGDGLVAARVLHDGGAAVQLYVYKRAAEGDDPNWEQCARRGIPFTRAEDDSALSQLREKVEQADFILDALLGTGVSRALEGTLRGLLDTVRDARDKNPAAPSLVFLSQSPNQPPIHSPARPTLIAIDLPTGLNPDTGALDPATLRADLTVTFAFPKIGHYAFPGADAVGELVVADIGIPYVWAHEIALDVATGSEIRALLPERPRNSNKGTFGKTMLACGSLNFTGAPVLAARAAGRAGAGLVTLAVPQTIHATIASRIDEATFLPLPDRLGDWRPRAANELLATLWDTNYDALVVGCGLGRAEGTGEFVQRLLENLPTLEQPPGLVLDADALNLLAEVSEWWTRFPIPSPPILTPHPGEMARLLGVEIEDVQAERVESARNAAQEWGAVVVLKGAFTVIAAPEGQATLLPFATPALATAGTGDVLAGTIGGMLAQLRAAKDVPDGGQRTEGPDGRRRTEDGKREKSSGKRNKAKEEDEEARDDVEEQGARDSYDAAVAGGYVHGLAGALAAEAIGDAGVVAGDLIARLPEAMGGIRRL